MNINVNLSLRVCCMLCFFLIKSSLFAQTSQEANEYNKVSIASPTAGSLAKFVDIPVSLHTGIPDINIPLYTISDGALSVPISMSYHASGLKVLEPAGWVGAGWALNAGGVITRSVRGTPDEKGTVNGFQHSGFFSDYGYRNHIIWPTNSGGRTDSLIVADYSRFQSGEFDSEPDLFFFNFGGYSGKFYFNDDRTPMLLPEQDIKIEYNYTYGSSQSIQGFTLTTPDGVKYYFGATPSTTDVDPVEYTKVFTDQNGLGWDKVLSSWYLNKIVSADGNNSITLNYRSVFYSYYTLSMGVTANAGYQAGYKLIRNYIHGVELDNIVSSNGQVNFIPSAFAREDLSDTNTNGVEGVNTTAKALGRIDILKKSSQQLLKSFNFSYDYFTDNTSTVASNLSFVTTDTKRLKLLAIQEKSATGILNPPYQFDYFSEAVPRRLSFGQDHWGFINGITTNGNNLIATYYNTNGTKATVTGADRDPRWPAMRGATLQKITFPTGGYNLYEFEPNQFYTSTTTGSGGDRVQIGNTISAGMDGGTTNNPNSIYVAIDSHQYVFKVSNGYNGGTGAFNVYNSNNVLMDQVSIANSETKEITRNYSPGTYRLEITKFNPYSGSGVQLSVYQLSGTVVNTNSIVAGLRIKTITQNSGLGNPDMVTSYDYSDGPGSTLSSGILFGKPTVAQVLRNDIVKNYNGATGLYTNGCPVTSGSGLAYMLSAGSVRAMNATQGSHIGYKRVTVNQAGKGSSVSMFNTDGDSGITHDDIVNRSIVTTPNTCTMDIPNYPAIPEPNYFNRGQLIYKADYDAAGTLLDDALFSTDYQDNAMTTPAFVIVSNPGTGSNPSFFTWYNQSTGRKIKETAVRKSYNVNGTVTNTSDSYYESAYHHQVTRTVTTNSTGDTYETRYRYVPDFTLSNVDLLNSGLSSYTADFTSATNTFNAQMAACTGALVCQHNAWLDYDIALSHARLPFVNYRITNFTGPNNTYTTRLQAALGTASADLKPIIGLRLQNNLQVIESTSYRNGKVLGSVFNSYDYKPNSGNQIYLSKVSKTEFLIPQLSFTQAATGSDNVTLVKDGNYKEKAYFDYKAGNVAQVTPKDDVPTSYLWSYNNQYPVAKAVNAQSNEIMFNGFEEGGWDANMTAYDSNVKHSGLVSGRIDVSTSAGTSMSNTWLGITLTAAKMYHYAAWVYSNGPSANVVLFMKRAGETGYYSYIDFVTTTVTGKWVYVEKDFLVPADVTQLNMRVDNNGTANGGSQVWFDDVRVYPTGALMTSYTYDPQVGMTGMTDAKGISTNYEYDPFQRLQNVKDKDGNIVKHIDYHYQGQ